MEVFTPEIQAKLASAGHATLPVFYTHPEVTRKNPTLEYLPELVKNPVNPLAVTLKVKIGAMSRNEMHAAFPLMGMIGRPSVVHFAEVTQWTPVKTTPVGVPATAITGDGMFTTSPCFTPSPL